MNIMMKQEPKISIVIPCFNEEGNIDILYHKVREAIRNYKSVEIIFVDDGSYDNTLSNVINLSEKDSSVKYISFSRNFGHQKALKAGIDHATGDCLISMDADLQHPPNLINKMIEKWMKGYDVVYTIRDDSFEKNIFKKITSSLFYKIMNWITDLKLEKGVADFRLLDRSVVDVLKEFNESHPFYRGLIGWIGFRQIGIKYHPDERFSGTTKYPLKKMMSLAVSGITAFSTKPLYIATITGFILSGLAVLYAFYAIYIYIYTDNVVPGWTSVLASLLFIGGFQLIVLGIIGEYIGKMFIEAKRRPIYIIKKTNVGTKE